MTEWWEALSTLERTLVGIATFSTIVLVAQTVMMFFSSVAPDTETDFDYMEDSPAGFDIGSLEIFTVRGVLSFFCIFGWSGVLFLSLDWLFIIALIVAFVFGVGFMYLTAYLYAFFLSLQAKGNMDIENTIGTAGTVYLRIPSQRKGTGKVSIIISGRLKEFDAVTDDSEDIPTGSDITISDVFAENVLLVNRNLQLEE